MSAFNVRQNFYVKVVSETKVGPQQGYGNGFYSTKTHTLLFVDTILYVKLLLIEDVWKVWFC